MKTIIRFISINAQSVAITVFVLLLGLSSCSDDEETVPDNKVKYSGTFVKSGDAVVTSATGSVNATFDPTTSVLSYKITWSGLTSNAQGMHFHDAGPVIIPITGFEQATSGSYSGIDTLTAEYAADLAAGKIYAQIHTVNIPSGEILATLLKVNTTSNAGGNGGGGY